MLQVMIPLDEDKLQSFNKLLYGRGYQSKPDLDTSVAIHRLAFGRFDTAVMPRPFAVIRESIGHVFHGYTTQPLSELRRSPIVNEQWNGVDPFTWEAAKEREIPEFKQAQTFTFRLVCSPTVRTMTPQGKSVEADAYLSARKQEPEITKEKAYERWLGKKLVVSRGEETIVAARLVPHTFQILGEAQKTAMRPLYEKDRTRLAKHSYGKMRKIMCAGSVEVLDGAAFRDVLAKGIGRSKAYGMGMMQLLR